MYTVVHTDIEHIKDSFTFKLLHCNNYGQITALLTCVIPIEDMLLWATLTISTHPPFSLFINRPSGTAEPSPKLLCWKLIFATRWKQLGPNPNNAAHVCSTTTSGAGKYCFGKCNVDDLPLCNAFNALATFTGRWQNCCIAVGRTKGGRKCDAKQGVWREVFGLQRWVFWKVGVVP